MTPASPSSPTSSAGRFIGLKDLVFSVIVGVIILVVGLVIAMPFAASLQLTYFLTPALAGIVWAILFTVIMGRCPRTGAVLVPFVIYGAYFVAMGSVYVGLLFLIAGVLAELAVWGAGHGSVVREFFPPLFMTLSNAMGSTLTLLLFRDSMVQTYMAMGLDEATADASISALEVFWLAPQNVAIALAAATAGALVGYVVGVKLVKKHFRPAGAV